MKKLCILSMLALPLLFQFCSSTKKSGNAVIILKTTYTADVQAIIIANCSPCHIPPKGFKKALDTYDAAKSNIDEMISRIQKQPDEKDLCLLNMINLLIPPSWFL